MVLVVDDSDLDRELTIRCLKKAWPGAGHPILGSAGDGIEALQPLRNVPYSLLILAGGRTFEKLSLTAQIRSVLPRFIPLRLLFRPPLPSDAVS